MMRYFALTIIGLINFCFTYSQCYTSGYYSGSIPVYIAVDSTTNTISGYIYTKNERITCELFFKGKINKFNYTNYIEFYDYWSIDEIEPGTISCDSFNTIWIKSKNFLMPCGSLISLKDGENAVLEKRYNFINITLLKEIKQHFYEKPFYNSRKNTYIIHRDPIAIIKEQGSWVYVQYLKNKMTRGWIPKASIY